MSDVGSLFEGRVSFAVGTGRCGTRFLQQVLSREPGVSAVHERNRWNETFHRYCKWYDLPVDHEGFLSTKEREICQDLEDHDISHEASAHLSLSILELYERFRAKFVLLVRSPQRVINSYIRKGWYEEAVVWKDTSKALGYQPEMQMHHFWGRIVPRGQAFEFWQSLGRVGKLAWYWNVLNQSILEQFERLPESHYHIVRLEDLNFETYVDLARFLGIKSTIRAVEYEKIVSRRPNRLPKVVTVSDWNAKDVEEFEMLVEPMARHFDYPFCVDKLQPDTRRKSQGSMIRERIYDLWLRLLATKRRLF